MEETEPGLRIRSAEGRAEFRLAPNHDGVQSYRATLIAGLMSAEVEVGVVRSRLARYFADIATDWRGWTGVREVTFSPPSSDYAFHLARIAARADGRGHVTFRCELGDPWMPSREAEQFPTHTGPGQLTDDGSWATEALVVVEAAALDELAKSADALPFDSQGLW